MMKILIVEDDVTIATMIQTYLTDNGFIAIQADTLAKAKQKLSADIALILLDYNLSDGNGFDFCKAIKQNFKTPIIFLTVNDNEEDIIKCLDMGADDYITKPFKLAVMYSRINAVLRRSHTPTDKLTCNDITLNKETGKVYYNQKEIELSAIEYRLLLLLIENKNHIMTRSIMLEKLWDNNGNFVNDNTLTVTMKRLREKLENSICIKTIRGVGYRLEESRNV